MGRRDLERQARDLERAAPRVYLRYDSRIKANLEGTPQAAEYEEAKRTYNIDGCADAISDMATTLKGIARRAKK